MEFPPTVYIDNMLVSPSEQADTVASCVLKRLNILYSLVVLLVSSWLSRISIEHF